MHWLLCARLGTPGACKHHTQVHSSQGGTGGTNSRGMAETFSPLLGWGLQRPSNAVTCRRCFPSIHGKQQQALLRPAPFSGSLQPLPTSTRISQSREVGDTYWARFHGPPRQSQTLQGEKPKMNPWWDVCSDLQPPARAAPINSVLPSLCDCFPLFPLKTEFLTLRTISTAQMSLVELNLLPSFQFFSSKGIVVVPVFARVILVLNESSLCQFAYQKIVIRIPCLFFF